MAIFPVDFPFLEEPEVEIVNEGGGSGGFVGFALDAGDEGFKGEGVTRRPALE
jgi:hypothetical protein